MKKPMYTKTIVGDKNVQRTGYLRSPDHFRIQIYEDGEIVITTKGKIATSDISSFVTRMSKLTSS